MPPVFRPLIPWACFLGFFDVFWNFLGLFFLVFVLLFLRFFLVFFKWNLIGFCFLGFLGLKKVWNFLGSLGAL